MHHTCIGSYKHMFTYAYTQSMKFRSLTFVDCRCRVGQYTHMLTFTHTHIHTYTDAYICTYTCKYIHGYMCTVHALIHTGIHTCMQAYGIKENQHSIVTFCILRDVTLKYYVIVAMLDLHCSMQIMQSELYVRY